MNTTFLNFTNNAFRVALMSTAFLGLMAETPVAAGKVKGKEEEANEPRVSQQTRQTVSPSREEKIDSEELEGLDQLLKGKREQDAIVSTLKAAGITSSEQIAVLSPLLQGANDRHTKRIVSTLGRAGMTSTGQIGALSRLSSALGLGTLDFLDLIRHFEQKGITSLEQIDALSPTVGVINAWGVTEISTCIEKANRASVEEIQALSGLFSRLNTKENSRYILFCRLEAVGITSPCQINALSHLLGSTEDDYNVVGIASRLGGAEITSPDQVNALSDLFSRWRIEEESRSRLVDKLEEARITSPEQISTLSSLSLGRVGSMNNYRALIDGLILADINSREQMRALFSLVESTGDCIPGMVLKLWTAKITSSDQMNALSDLFSLWSIGEESCSSLVRQLGRAKLTSPEQIKALLPLLEARDGYDDGFIYILGEAGITSPEQMRVLSSLLADMEGVHEKIRLIENLARADLTSYDELGSFPKQYLNDERFWQEIAERLDLPSWRPWLQGRYPAKWRYALRTLLQLARGRTGEHPSVQGS